MALDRGACPLHYVCMRLTDHQQAEILRTLEEVFGSEASVTLFGSRVDDQKRGGDIDLMITTDLNTVDARRAKIRFLARLKQRIGDRRIDVVLRTPDSDDSGIHQVALDEGVEIR